MEGWGIFWLNVFGCSDGQKSSWLLFPVGGKYLETCLDCFWTKSTYLGIVLVERYQLVNRENNQGHAHVESKMPLKRR